LTDYFGTNRYSDVVSVIYTLYIPRVRHYTRRAALDNGAVGLSSVCSSAPFAARLGTRLVPAWNLRLNAVAWVTGGGESGMGYRGKRPKQGFKTPPETSLRV
jgi:hypothetical protein